MLSSEFLCTECHGSTEVRPAEDQGRLLGGDDKQVGIRKLSRSQQGELRERG